MLGFDSIGTTAIAAPGGPTASDFSVLQAFVGKPVVGLVYTLEVSPFPPGVEVVFPDDDTTVLVSFAQFRVPLV